MKMRKGVIENFMGLANQEFLRLGLRVKEQVQ